MFNYLDDDGLNEYSVFVGVESSSLFDGIGPFDPHTFSAYTKFSEDIQTVPDRVFSPFDTSYDSSSSQSVSTPETSEDSDSSSSQSLNTSETGDDSDSNHSVSGKSVVFTSHPEKDSNTSITGARRRSWKSFRRSLPANLRIAPEDPLEDIPEQPLQPFRRRSSATKRSIYSPHSTAKRVRLAPPSRNRQASQATSLAITRVVNNNLIEETNFICPECGWVQENKRVPDFKRHLKTHLRPKDNDHSSGYWCKGVCIEDANQYTIQPNAAPYRFLDHERIGGCMRTFSRRDALKRHLDNTNISCVAETLD